MQTRRLRHLNVRLALSLLIALAALIGGIYGLHRFQVGRTSQKMLERAKTAQKEGRVEDAIRFYDYYLRYSPKDDEVFTALALLVADRAKKSPANARAQIDAYRRLEAAAIRQPNNLEVIRRLADISIQVGQHQVAEEHLRRLIQQFPEESDLEVKLGRCQMATEHYRDAMATFQAVIGRDPQNLDAYVELAALRRDKLDDREEADAVINQMVSANPGSPRAYVERARYWKHLKMHQEAKADLELALQKGPNNLDVLLAAAQFALDEKDLPTAKRYLEQANKLFPNDLRVQQGLADLYRAQNDPVKYRQYQEKAFAQASDPLALIKVAEAQLSTGDVEAVRKTIRQMRQAGYRPELLDFFEGRILLAQGKLREGVAALERLRPKVVAWPEFALQIDMYLGACYEQLRLPDRQLEAYRRALGEDPSLVPARIGYAGALFRTGKFRQALDEYRKLQQSMGVEPFLKSAPLRTTLFQLLLIRTAQLPEKQRDWKEAEDLLAKAEKLGTMDEIQRALMRAELLVKKGQFAQARELVAAAHKNHPKDFGLWTSLATATALEEGPKRGLAVLDEAAKTLGNSLGLELARANLIVQMPGPEAKPLLQAAEDRVAKLPSQEHAMAWQALGGAYYRLMDRAKAKQLWTKAAAADPTDGRIRLMLFDLAREANDQPGMSEAGEAVKKLFGSRSAEWLYCEASRLVWQVQNRQADPAILDQAKPLLRSAAELRPTWHEIARLEGEIAILENRADDAIEHFQRANDLGALSPVHMGQLARLLFMRGRYDEAKVVLDQLGPERSSPLMEKMEAEVSQRLGQADEALKLAAQSVAGSKNAVDFLWYGQLLARAGKNDEAEKAYRRAIELDAKIPESYLALVALLVQMDRASEAEKVLRQAQLQLPEDRTPMVLAECYQILGNSASAEQYYLSALALKPESLPILRRVAEFYLRTDRPQQARKYLSQIVKLAGRDPRLHREQLIWARRALAQVLADSGEYHQLQQALALLEQNAPKGKPDPVDLRLQAAILARSNERSARLKAIALLESLQARNTALDPDDQFLLAQLYDKTNRWSQSREMMLELLTQYPKEIRYLVQYIQMLLAHSSPIDEITPWVERLEQAQPNLAIARITRAQVLAKAGNTTEAVKLLESLIPRPLPLDKVGYLRDVAKLLEDIQQYEPAQKLLAEFAEKAPGGSLTLAGFLGRHGTADEALDCCEAALKDLPLPAVLPVATAILRHQAERARPEHFRRVEAWFQQALQEYPQSKSVQLQLASLRDLQDRYDDLIRIYRDFLARDDISDRERAVVWNNLAYVLAASGTSVREAEEMINRAVSISGPTPELLDTRGVVFLATGKLQEAINDFRQSIAENPSGMKYFHLALAHMSAGDRDAATRALKVAHDSHQLTVGEVPKLERAKYRKLLADLQAKG